MNSHRFIHTKGKAEKTTAVGEDHGNDHDHDDNRHRDYGRWTF